MQAVMGTVLQGEPFADLCWILLLCLFSLFARSAGRSRLRYSFLSVAFLLLVLAAFHSHSLWSFANRGSARHAETATTRITAIPSLTMATGLELDERVTSMAFDPDGKLWLSSGNESPTIYDTSTNTAEDLLAPGAVYGLYGAEDGMWVFTARAALLYAHEEPAERITFPQGTVPLCAARWQKRLYFGTTRGLYVMEGAGARHIVLSEPIYQLTPAENSLLVVADNRLWRFDGRRCSTLVTATGNHGNIFGALYHSGSIFIARDSDGIMTFANGRWVPVRFASATLNMASRGAVVLYRGVPCIGTMEGSIVMFSSGKWNRIRAGNGPVTALAGNGNHLYAWTGIELIAVQLTDL